MTDHMKYLSARDKKLNTVELKPCPFCGGRAIQRYDSHIYCEEVTSCGAAVDFGHWVGGNEKESMECRKAVAESWNQRAEKRLEELKAALKEITINGCDEDARQARAALQENE